MLVYEMKPKCYNMYKWGVQTDVGGTNRKEPKVLYVKQFSFISFSHQLKRNNSVLVRQNEAVKKSLTVFIKAFFCSSFVVA